MPRSYFRRISDSKPSRELISRDSWFPLSKSKQRFMTTTESSGERTESRRLPIQKHTLRKQAFESKQSENTFGAVLATIDEIAVEHVDVLFAGQSIELEDSEQIFQLACPAFFSDHDFAVDSEQAPLANAGKPMQTPRTVNIADDRDPRFNFQMDDVRFLFQESLRLFDDGAGVLLIQDAAVSE